MYVEHGLPHGADYILVSCYRLERKQVSGLTVCRNTSCLADLMLCPSVLFFTLIQLQEKCLFQVLEFSFLSFEGIIRNLQAFSGVMGGWFRYWFKNSNGRTGRLFCWGSDWLVDALKVEVWTLRVETVWTMNWKGTEIVRSLFDCRGQNRIELIKWPTVHASDLLLHSLALLMVGTCNQSGLWRIFNHNAQRCTLKLAISMI